MNKQEALEALLAKMRQWERSDAEVPATDTGRVMEALQRNHARMTDLLDASKDPDVRAELITIGAAALYLLVDEVEVVEGRSLEEWLAPEPGGRRVRQPMYLGPTAPVTPKEL